jgi:site-specific DNA-methyltransferase (adenine-specific)
MKQFKIYEGSNLDILPTLPNNSVDSIVTDPPYELGFMGKSWDSTGIAYNIKMWEQCLRVLKPGGHLVAFSGSRTYHRMAVAIEDAGFQIRDQMMWVYGSGFPKSLNISKALDKMANAERKVIGEKKPCGMFSPDIPHFGNASSVVETYKSSPITVPSTEAAKQWEGWGTALKPAHEPIVLARKPLEGTVAENVLKWGVGGLNIDRCRVDNNGEQFGELPNWDGGKQINKEGLSFEEQGHDYKDGGNAEAVDKLKRLGRFPANFMHDGSDEVVELFPNTVGGKFSKRSRSRKGFMISGSKDNIQEANAPDNYGDSGSAGRFFYCPKANKKDRDEGCEELEQRRESDRIKDDGVGGDNPRNRSNNLRKNSHPTVKPTELMRYLCRLVTPSNGIVLDPFNGSGSTGKAAIIEGFEYIGIELDPDYIKISEARIKKYV